MLKKIMVFMLILTSIILYCQVPFGDSYFIIDNEWTNLQSGFPIDIDNDDDTDIIAVNFQHLILYENNNNLTFTSNVVSSIYWGNSIFATDIDFDSDIDILTSSSNEHEIAWYENNGNQVFVQHTIPTTALRPTCVYAIDIDMDNDMDFLTSTEWETMICLYINDGDFNFTETVIDSVLDAASYVSSIDLDEDNDLDIISASFSYGISGYIKWYENVNNEFNEHILPLGNWIPSSINTIDFDYDNDIDILVALTTHASSYNDKVIMFENQGLEYNYAFEEMDLVTNQYLVGLMAIAAADYDNDLDIDLILSESYFLAPQSEWFSMNYCENDGSGNMILTCFDSDIGNIQIFNTDMDSDADIDIVCISDYFRSRIYENSFITGIGNNELLSLNYMISNHPNPFNPITTIEFLIQNDSKVDLSVFNIKGQKIKSLVKTDYIAGSHSITWNGDDDLGKSVGSGVYYYKLNINGKTEVVKKCLLLK